ncbi:MAG: uL30 family ribosomal protein [Candidatus Pacearchaeota archaeon]|nr:uL30 family ribosomal protein [Candidatus Pacearchaeota archaeon]
MIAVIRIKGIVGLDRDINETFKRLKLGRKYSCIVVEEKPEILGMINKVESFVAYGKIDEATLKELQEKRGKGKKTNFFRLHPPRGGIKAKVHYPRGVLGNHKDKINDLIRRML